MYRFERIEGDTEPDEEIEDHEMFAIYDPEGDELAVVYNEGEAEALVSHLNRG